MLPPILARRAIRRIAWDNSAMVGHRSSKARYGDNEKTPRVSPGGASTQTPETD